MAPPSRMFPAYNCKMGDRWTMTESGGRNGLRALRCTRRATGTHECQRERIIRTTRSITWSRQAPSPRVTPGPIGRLWQTPSRRRAGSMRPTPAPQMATAAAVRAWSTSSTRRQRSDSSSQRGGQLAGIGMPDRSAASPSVSGRRSRVRDKADKIGPLRHALSGTFDTGSGWDKGMPARPGETAHPRTGRRGRVRRCDYDATILGHRSHVKGSRRVAACSFAGAPTGAGPASGCGL